jgi:hypothetical protein
MDIFIKYLDKRKGTIEAIKDYDNMQFIIDRTENDIKDAYEDMTSLKSVNLNGLPKAHNPKAGEDSIINSIEKISVLETRYDDAMEYMKWFGPAWQRLSEDERYILKTFYNSRYGERLDAIYDICEKLGIERTTAYKRKNKALTKLEKMLFG